MNKIKIKFFVLFIFFHVNASAQENKSLASKEYDVSNADKSLVDYSNTYITDKNADKFAGTWRWLNGNNELILKLVKTQRNDGTKGKPWIRDVLKGEIQNIKDGKALSKPDTGKMIGGSEGHPDKIYLYYSDARLNKLVAFEAYMIEHNKMKLILSKRKREWQAYSVDTSIPVDIILTKVD